MTIIQLEKRIAAIEDELEKLKESSASEDDTRPWWRRISGTFKDDPIYAEAMRLGKRFRKSSGKTRKPRNGRTRH